MTHNPDTAMPATTAQTEKSENPRSYAARFLLSPSFASLLVFVCIVLIWHYSIYLFDLPALLLPGPISVLKAFWIGIIDGSYLRHSQATLLEVFWGFSVGTIAAVVVASILSQSRLLERMFYPYMVALQTFPKIAIAPLLITWFGFGIGPKAIIAGILAFFPVLINMMIGLRSVDRDQLELLRSFAASRWQILWLCKLRSALPFFFAGIETGIVLAMLGAITAEFVGARSGLGYLVVQKNAVMSIDGVFAILVLLGLIGVGLHLAVRYVHARVVFWK